PLVLPGRPLLCEALPQLTPAWTPAPVSRRLPPLPGCDLQARRTDGRVVTAKHLGELKERELRLAASVHRILPRCDEAPALARPEKLVARHAMGLRNLVDDGVQSGSPVLLGCHAVSSFVSHHSPSLSSVGRAALSRARQYTSGSVGCSPRPSTDRQPGHS